MFLEVIWYWISIILRIVFIFFTGYLINSIVCCIKHVKLDAKNQNKVKIAVLSVVLCVCILLGYTEPPAKIRVEKDTVADTFAYFKQNQEIFTEGQDFNTQDMFGWVCYLDAERSKSILKEIKMTEEEKETSEIGYPTYVLCDVVNDIEIYYEEAKCERWSGFGDFSVDLLGMPNEDSISTMVYLVLGDECVVAQIHYDGFNPFFFLQFLTNPYFFYSPEINFKEIISSIK